MKRHANTRNEGDDEEEDAMKKKSFVLGFGVGYILGARAGRQRYEQIVDLWNQLIGSPRVQDAAARTRYVASAGARRGLTVVQRGVAKTGEAVRERLNRGETESGNGFSG
jgi:hypothetical protein